MNFPTTHDEAWRYTNLAPLQKLQFVDDDAAPLSALPKELEAEAQLVFVNGRFMPALSTAQFADVSISYKPQLPKAEDVFSQLSASSAVDGADIHIHAKALLRLLHISDSRKGVTLSNPRVKLSLDAGTQATIIERFASLGTHACFTNAQSLVALGENAQLTYLKWQDESAEAFHIAHMQVLQAKESRLDASLFAFGGKLARTTLSCALSEATSTELRGLLLAGAGQTQDVVTLMQHDKPFGHSNQLFKCVLNEDGRSAFDGRVRVAKDAQKTDARQKNQNLMLSKEATATSKPHLEIYADDVKCAHGSTSGQISGEALFYLRSRGIPEREAKALLTTGFAGEVIALAPLLADAARARVDAWLR